MNINFINHTKNRILSYLKKRKLKHKSKILFIGLTYKKNIDDIRNSGSEKIFNTIKKKYYNLDKFDTELNIKNKFKLDKYEAFILMVMHDKNKKSRQIINYLKNTEKCFDVFSQL